MKSPTDSFFPIPPWMVFLAGMAVLMLGVNTYFAILAYHHLPGMVREDYYAASLRWDQKRAREKRFDSLGLNLALRENSGALQLEGSASPALDSATLNRLAGSSIQLRLVRPDDPAADRHLVLHPELPFLPGQACHWSVAATQLRHGKWNAQLQFESEGRAVMERSFSYFAEN